MRVICQLTGQPTASEARANVVSCRVALYPMMRTGPPRMDSACLIFAVFIASVRGDGMPGAGGWIQETGNGNQGAGIREADGLAATLMQMQVCCTSPTPRFLNPDS